MLRLPSLALLFVASLGAACAAPDESADSSESAWRVEPQGEETMAKLTVTLPAGTCSPGQQCSRALGYRPRLWVDAREINLGETVRVAPGSRELKVGLARPEDGRVVGFTRTLLGMAAGATKVLVLPVVKRTCMQGADGTLPETHFGYQPTVSFAPCPTPTSVDGRPIPALVDAIEIFGEPGCKQRLASMGPTTHCEDYYANTPARARSASMRGLGCRELAVWRDVRGFCEAFRAGDYLSLGVPSPFMADYTAVVPGTYTFPISTPNGVTTDARALSEGLVEDLEFVLPRLGTTPERYQTVLHFVDARALRAATPLIASSTCGRSYEVPASASGTVVLQAFKSGCSDSLTVGGRTVVLDANRTNEITLHRIDVDDVRVTREDGAQIKVPGRYELFFGGAKVAGPFPTNTGVDALPGAYQLVVTYPTALGEKTNRYAISL